MKVLVTCQGTELDSPVDPRFGRAAGFLLVDTKTGEFVVVDNAQNVKAAQGAGTQAAQTAAQLGADAVLTGHVGEKAFATLDAAGIAVYTGASGPVSKAIEHFKAGQLQKAEQASPWT